MSMAGRASRDRPPVRGGVVVAVLATALALPAAHAEQRGSGSTLRTVTLTRVDQATVVTIESDGPIPEPEHGVLDAPARIYLDFQGVRAGTTGLRAAKDPLVKRIRVALHRTSPTVTRLVIDLTGQQPFHLSRDPRTPSRLTVVVGAATALPPEESTATIAPVPPLPPPAGEVAVVPAAAPGAAPAANAVPATTASKDTVPPAPVSRRETSPAKAAAPLTRDLERYREQMAAVLDRMALYRKFLESLHADDEFSAEQAEAAVDEFQRLRGTLAAYKASEAVAPTHNLLLQASTLAGMAARIRLDALRSGDASGLRNASSAAAGSLLLLDRACGDLRCAGR